MKFLVQWHLNTNITGIFKGAKDVEAISIEDAMSKCRRRVVEEDFKDCNPSRIRIIQVIQYKE